MRAAVLCTFVVALALKSGQAQEAKKGTAREIAVPGFVGGEVKGKVGSPTKLASADDLAKALPTKEFQKKVAGEVDFKAEHVLYFAWGGSGGDKLAVATAKGDKGPVVTFTYMAGLTDDLRFHHKLFAVPNDAQVVLPK